MRLIDAGLLVEKMYCFCRAERYSHEAEKDFIGLVNSQPTALDKNEVIKQISNASQKMSTAKLPHTYYSAVSKEKAVGIVEAGGV